MKLLYILHENVPLEEVGLNLMLLEHIPHLVDCGVLTVEGDKTKVDIPILSSFEYNEISNLVFSISYEISENLSADFSEFLKNVKTPVPKHLTSVPEHIRYKQSTENIPMMVVFQAIQSGFIGQDIDYPCPPMLMIVDN